MKLWKGLFICAFAVAIALLCVFTLPKTAEAASINDLTFTLNETRDGYIVTSCKSSANGELVIPTTYNDLPITSIGQHAFVRCAGITNITVPESVTSIGFGAFYGCSDLVSITIPDSVTLIATGAFSSCTSLTSITIPKSVVCIGAEVFSDCTGLINLQVEEGNAVYHSVGNCIIKTDSKTLIAGCKVSLIPADGSVTSIGESAFEGCSGLTSITIPDSITSIGDCAFDRCTGLVSINIPDSVSGVGYAAFRSCTGLTSITLSNSIIAISDYAFYYCSGLNNITIPDSVTSIGYCAFYNCSSLTSVTYCGTQEQWDAIEKDGNYSLEDATLQFHDWMDATCTAPKTCTYCGATDGEATGHSYENGECTLCGCVTGDMDGDGSVTYKDAVYLLLHILFGEEKYPMYNAPADIDGNSKVDQGDAVYLLLHALFGESFYPLKG